LQKSRNGTSFETVASIQSGTDNKYNYTDKQVGDGNYFYRLKMIDTDGKTTYSAIISVSISCNNENNLVVFPNPAHDKVFIKSNGNIKEAILMATNGQTVHVLKGNSEPEIEMNIKNLPAGLYLLRITKIDGSYKNFKVVKE
jgi:hypothetical protein